MDQKKLIDVLTTKQQVWNRWNKMSDERADLGGAKLREADLRGADLREASLNWQSHLLLAEVLRQAAGNNLHHRMIAGVVLISPEWCWDDFKF